jgi:hypothetical protein
VKACIFSAGWIGVAISLSTSGSEELSCGVNTSARWFANSSTFSLSLLAQGPGGIVFLRIGQSCGTLQYTTPTAYTVFIRVCVATTWSNGGVSEDFIWRVCLLEAWHLKLNIH